MGEGYFNPWRDAPERDCRTCRYSIGRPDGVHLWCERHRLVVVFPCGLWERAAGAEERRITARRDRSELESLPPALVVFANAVTVTGPWIDREAAASDDSRTILLAQLC
jgi:hypothetical protein